MKQYIFKFFALTLSIILLTTSCRDAQKEILIKFSGKALGTYYNISYYDSLGRDFQDDIDELFAAFNASLSIYDTHSLISKINRNEIDAPIDDQWFIEVFKVSKEVYKKTSAYFDPSVGPLINAWGFGSSNTESMNQEKIDSILTFVGFNKIQFYQGEIIKEDERIQLDFNAIAKGYCADVAARFLESQGISGYLVEIGGEITSKGKKSDDSFWRIGIEKPAEDYLDKQEVMQIINLHNRSLATSGNYRRYLEKDDKRFSHTIDPHSGYPVENNLLSVTVVATSCILADAYATAFMAMGIDKALALVQKDKDLEAFFIYVDEGNLIKIKATQGFEEMME